MLSGCVSNLTVGELRRRELFDALLLAWVVGLAIAFTAISLAAWLGFSRAPRHAPRTVE